MKRIVILGSTGSIGESTVMVAKELSDRIRVTGLAVERNVGRVVEQAAELGVNDVAVADEAAAAECRRTAPPGVRIHTGAEGVAGLAAAAEADMVVCAIVGMAGLRPVLEAVSHGKDIALATKEVLVAAGHLVTRAAEASGSRLLPVDSEHSAVFQCIGERPMHEVSRIILTASGGPFGGDAKVDFDKVTAAEALAHPRWNMGRKVTVDSASLMNKGLEIMEAHWLFSMPIDRIAVLIHLESIVHSLVEFVDGSVLAQMCPPDMRFAIQYALTHPERVPGGLPALDLAQAAALHFGEPDLDRFPCLRLALEAARCAGSMPAVLNAANETAVERFLAGRIPFSGIWRTVENVMNEHETVADPDLDTVLGFDTWARTRAEEVSG